jgi:uncharacterized membrane protein (DUF2068 family)
VSEVAEPQTFASPPGTGIFGRRRRRSYELLACGWRGHVLIGTDAAEIGPEDAIFVRELGGVRWHRCLRCDAWLALPPPKSPTRERPPARAEIELPIRGRPLRDKVVLRVIAVDRALHFLILGVLAVALFVFAAHRATLAHGFYRLVTDLQGGIGGGPIQTSKTGILHDLDRLLTLKTSSLDRIGLVVAVYATIEGVEAVGLWYAKRWAEYLTFIATTALLPLEVFELTNRVTPFKLLALIVNLAIVIWLIYDKRLFGVRGGGRVDELVREHDSSWEAVEHATPPPWPAGT